MYDPNFVKFTDLIDEYVARKLLSVNEYDSALINAKNALNEAIEDIYKTANYAANALTHLKAVL